MTTPLWLGIECRKCHAMPGERCVSVDRKKDSYPRYVAPHAVRRSDAKLRAEVQP